MSEELIVGTFVKFEICKTGYPRWDHFNDSGGIGIFKEGKVVAVYEDSFTVSFCYNDCEYSESNATTSWDFQNSLWNKFKSHPGVPVSLEKANALGIYKSSFNGGWLPEIGEFVKFERGYNGEPRWRLGSDYGGSGIFGLGEVVKVGPATISVKYSPYSNNPSKFKTITLFYSSQWEDETQYPGGLAKVKYPSELLKPLTYKDGEVFYVKVASGISSVKHPITEKKVSAGSASKAIRYLDKILLLDFCGDDDWTASPDACWLEIDKISHEEYLSLKMKEQAKKNSLSAKKANEKEFL